MNRFSVVGVTRQSSPSSLGLPVAAACSGTDGHRRSRRGGRGSNQFPEMYSA